jgi:hypothetical protein
MRVKVLVALVSAILISICAKASAQDRGYEVFAPISKYLSQGEAEKVSAWFSDNLEITIFSNTSDCSRNQACQLLKSFFKSYTPRSFKIVHKAGRTNMKYALGTLTAGGEHFMVTIFVGYKDSSYKIQHLKIERME